MENLISKLFDEFALAAEVKWLEIFFSFTSDIVGIGLYVLTALSLFVIAKRRGIANPWLAWLPLVQFWIVGSIADHYRKSAFGKDTNKRKLLLWLKIAEVAFVIILFFAIVLAALAVLKAGYNNYNAPYDLPLVVISLCGATTVALLMVGTSIAGTVINGMALYDVYRSCDPANAVLYLVLSIVLQFTQPIFLIICCNKDKGMPFNTQESR